MFTSPEAEMIPNELKLILLFPFFLSILQTLKSGNNNKGGSLILKRISAG